MKLKMKIKIKSKLFIMAYRPESGTEQKVYCLLPSPLISINSLKPMPVQYR